MSLEIIETLVPLMQDSTQQLAPPGCQTGPERIAMPTSTLINSSSSSKSDAHHERAYVGALNKIVGLQKRINYDSVACESKE
ncbi:unnamed protein product [Dovyalis caffra]|uniref:Late endosomal/lysosomal adaptor and MAPK and MTOR activator 1 n=1 Tax=Dovyalis caffra TaxID=77055 RepID=A0AAV1S2P6_9ROSI|nr:unnamed protein product [Dovyalis caffra]